MTYSHKSRTRDNLGRESLFMSAWFELCCSVLRSVALSCNDGALWDFIHVRSVYSVLQCVVMIWRGESSLTSAVSSVRYSMVHFGAPCCTVLQCVAMIWRRQTFFTSAASTVYCSVMQCYGVATDSRIDKIMGHFLQNIGSFVGLFCKRDL